jgi:hypothetical protein
MKTRTVAAAILAISVTMLILNSSAAFVSADPCTATLSYPTVPVQYGGTNVPVVVPILASCTTYYGNQLYATGTAYDLTSNVNAGSGNTVLSSVNGDMQFNGQLSFNLPQVSQGDSIEISVTVYSNQYGSPITTTSETVQIGTGTQQTVTTTVTEGQYPYANPYPTQYPTPYPSPYQFNQSQQYQPMYQSQYQSYHSHTHSTSQNIGRNSSPNLLDYAVIITIIATVIIATTAAVLVARRQPHRPNSPMLLRPY